MVSFTVLYIIYVVNVNVCTCNVYIYIICYIQIDLLLYPIQAVSW